jgi:hypothetical protein
VKESFSSVGFASMMLSRFVAVGFLGAGLGVAANDCDCIFQGMDLPLLALGNSSDYGKEVASKYPNVGKVGTMCASWDRMPGTPWNSDCVTADPMSSDDNWCFLPYCYVDEMSNCNKSPSQFPGLFYSYAACGAPDCLASFDKEMCPYDPHGDGTARTDKAECACLFEGSLLPEEVLSNPSFPNSSSIGLYGTSCAAWDSSPGTLYSEYCPSGAEWCTAEFNWCVTPWCYVSEKCETAVGSTVVGSSMYYSYDTCLGTPDCSGFGEGCPYDGSSNGWYTGADCETEEPEPEDEPEPEEPPNGRCTRIPMEQAQRLDLRPCGVYKHTVAWAEN